MSESVPSSRRDEESAADSMLSRYFRDMATHQVMGPDEELAAAQAVGGCAVKGSWLCPTRSATDP